ncbi:MAG: rubrerythrin [Deltaproteobacteria bacterium]|nr:rubrerythrin [Deltaproteobacteria bacterium]
MRGTLRNLITVALVAILAAPLTTACKKKQEAAAGQQGPHPATAAGKTLANLQAAFNGESNAHARYAAFAQRADEEGFKDVAKLFRAASRAEQIHAEHHAEVIKAMGAEPAADVTTPEVKTTAENLQVAIDGETHEKDAMYPEFIQVATEEGANDAVRTFNFAKAAESDHARLYGEALANLDGWKAGDKTFFVCPTCGRTVTVLDFQSCGVCGEPASAYEPIA